MWPKSNVRYPLPLLCVDPELTHLTKLDDSLLPRAEALRDFTPTDSNHLSFRVSVVSLCAVKCVSLFSPHNTHWTSDRGGLGIFRQLELILNCEAMVWMCIGFLGSFLYYPHIHYCNLYPSLPPSLPVSQAGDVLNLLERIGSDWYSGENTRTGDFGDFPASSVRVIEPLP